jgi:hypothetical protein
VPRGGHFSALAQLELLPDGIRAFFRRVQEVA